MPHQRISTHRPASEAAPFAVFVAVQSAERILLVETDGRTHRTFPGGRGNAGEDIKAAAARKLKEEVGISVAPDQLKQMSERCNSGCGQPQYLLSLEVDDRFFSAVRGVGPKGHRTVIWQKQHLETSGLAEFVVSLIRHAR